MLEAQGLLMHVSEQKLNFLLVYITKLKLNYMKKAFLNKNEWCTRAFIFLSSHNTEMNKSACNIDISGIT